MRKPGDGCAQVTVRKDAPATSYKAILAMSAGGVRERTRRRGSVIRELRPTSPQPEVTDSPPLRRNLALSVGDGTSYGMMVGIGETYIPAFMLFVGMGDVFSGLITTVPLLIGSILQLISPWAVRTLGSHRQWVTLCAGLQGLCFIPFLMASLLGLISPFVAMFVASIYWGAGLATNPAWNTWQGTLVPRSIRTHFFARRARLQQMATLAGFLAGGFALEYGRQTGSETQALIFAALFTVAVICRGLSTFCLATQSEPAPIPASVRWLTWRETCQRATTGSTGRLLLFAVVMQAGVFVSGPFFNPYILKVLSFSYAEYAALLGASFVAKFMMLPLWGKFAHRFGAQRLLWVGAIGLIPLAGGWNISSNYGYLLVLQLVAGTAWGAYELALVLLFFETISERERTSVLTLYNFANSAAIVIGSAVGAVILQAGAVSPEAYHWVYAASTIMRLLAVGQLFFFWPRNLPSGDEEPAFQPMMCQPHMGSLDQPVLSGSTHNGDENLRASA